MASSKYIKLLKEKEKLLMDIEARLSDQLKSLKNEEIYLLTVLTQQTNEDEDGEEATVEGEVAEDMDSDAINRVPLTHLNAASNNFYQMFAGNNSQRDEMVEIEDEDEEEEEKDSKQEEAEMIEEKDEDFQTLMNSMMQEG